jgi:hypothetical protein
MTTHEYTPAAAVPATPKRRKRRIFLWVFLAIQVIFLIWVIAGSTEQTGPTAAQIASLCGKGQWQGLFTSYHDCVVHGANGLTAAGDIGKTIGLGLVIGLWVAVDVILGISYAIYRLARRSS